MNRIVEIVVWSICLLGLLFLLGFVNRQQENAVCQDIIINIDRSNGNFFVDESDINEMVYYERDTVKGKSMASIATESLEHKINNHPSVENAEVYKTINGNLVIAVQQRTPIVRIFNLQGESYYIDSTGKLMPPSANYTSRVLIANGYFTDSFYELAGQNARNVSDTIEHKTYIDDIFTFAEFIRKSPFWTAQIEQLYVNKELDIELIPRVGNHRIVFGDAVSIKEKFKKLELFYKNGLNKTGWNEYSTINLKYANQVVCTKR